MDQTTVPCPTESLPSLFHFKMDYFTKKETSSFNKNTYILISLGLSYGKIKNLPHPRPREKINFLKPLPCPGLMGKN